MLVWTVQKVAVVQEAVRTGIYIPDKSESDFVSCYSDNAYRKHMAELYRIITEIFWRRNHTEGIDPEEATGVCFGFAADDGEKIVNFD